MCALYFTGLALTDAAFRAEFHERVIGDVEQIMAVHAAYLMSPEVRADADGLTRRASCRSRAAESGQRPEWVVEMRGLEPLTPAMRTRCSPS